jgi:hypothetical protein
MASHMSSIGFAVQSERHFGDLVNHAIRHGAMFESANGAYIWWVAGRGVELWIQIDAGQNVVGLNPHFRRTSRMAMALTARVARPEESPLEGAFHAWANPAAGDPESGDYPLVFDAPDFDLYRQLPLPHFTHVQLAAFAHELSAFPDEAAYYAAQTDEPKWAAAAFVPTGLFHPADGNGSTPPAHALLAGRVVQHEPIRNPYSGQRFQWARVYTLGGEIDVVADPAIVAGDITTGGVIRGSFWLSGRLLEEPTAPLGD